MLNSLYRLGKTKFKIDKAMYVGAVGRVLWLYGLYGGMNIYWKVEKPKSLFMNHNSRKSVRWSAVPDAPKLMYVGMRW